MLPAPTPRLQFRAWSEDDLPLAMALWGDPRVGALVGGPFDEAQVRARLASELANQATHGVAYWPIATLDERPAPATRGPAGSIDSLDVGCCGLRPRDPARRIYELGFYLRVEHWGQGYAVEAGRSVIAFAFDTLGAPSLFAGHHRRLAMMLEGP